MVTVLLKDSYRVVVDATNINRDKRKIWINLSRELAFAPVHLQ
jgi:predicted kinase